MNEKINYNQCSKYFAKEFKLKVHTQNVHEIENIRYESTNDIMEMIRIFKNLQNSNVKGDGGLKFLQKEIGGIQN